MLLFHTLLLTAITASHPTARDTLVLDMGPQYKARGWILSPAQLRQKIIVIYSAVTVLGTVQQVDLPICVAVTSVIHTPEVRTSSMLFVRKLVWRRERVVRNTCQS